MLCLGHCLVRKTSTLHLPEHGLLIYPCAGLEDVALTDHAGVLASHSGLIVTLLTMTLMVIALQGDNSLSGRHQRSSHTDESFQFRKREENARIEESK